MAFDYRACPILLDALRYWNRKRGGRPMPARRDIDPVEVPQLLPNLQLTEVVDGGTRFRYRLVGTAIVEAFGAEFTGKYVDELLSGDRSRFTHDFYRAVCTARRPVFIRSRYLGGKDTNHTANRLLMLLSADGVQVNMILGALTFELTASAAVQIGHGAPIDPSASHIEIVDLEEDE